VKPGVRASACISAGICCAKPRRRKAPRAEEIKSYLYANSPPPPDRRAFHSASLRERPAAMKPYNDSLLSLSHKGGKCGDLAGCLPGVGTTALTVMSASSRKRSPSQRRQVQHRMSGMRPPWLVPL